MMAHVPEYSIVTYQWEPGHWRAAIFPKVRSQIVVRDEVLSVVTPDDCASETDAQFAAEKFIREL